MTKDVSAMLVCKTKEYNTYFSWIYYIFIRQKQNSCLTGNCVNSDKTWRSSCWRWIGVDSVVVNVILVLKILVLILVS